MNDVTKSGATAPTNGAGGSLQRRQVLVAILADLAIVIAFITIGRRNHDEDASFSGFLNSVAPFVIALVLSWILGRVWRRPTGIGSGVVVWVGTIAPGMVLRRFLFDDGTATAFVIVATIFLGAFMNGWRTYARFRASS